MCRNQADVLARLGQLGVDNMESLGELMSTDVTSIPFKDIVVRRRLLNWVERYPKAPLAGAATLADLCLNHQRTITQLAQSGVQTLDDLRELEPEDILELKLKHLVITRRLVRYITKPHEEDDTPPSAPPAVHHSRSSGSRITMSDADARAMSPVRAPRTKKRT